MKRELGEMERESVELRLEWAGKNKEWEGRNNLVPSEEQVERMNARLQAESEKDSDWRQTVLQTILEHLETHTHSRDLMGWMAVYNHRRAMEELAERLENGSVAVTRRLSHSGHPRPVMYAALLRSGHDPLRDSLQVGLCPSLGVSTGGVRLSEVSMLFGSHSCTQRLMYTMD